jgi:hypothetical protein
MKRCYDDAVRFARFASIRAAITFGALGAGALPLGCSALVQFDDQPSCDGGLCAEDASLAFDSSADSPLAFDGGANDAAKDASRDVFDESCKGLNAGMYCALDHLKGYLGAQTDLVNCDGGAVYAVVHCGDAGCVSMVDPFPDTCNECPQKSNGTFCGRDFSGFPTADSDMLIGCQSGIVVQNFACPHGCKSAGSDASCYP